MVGFLNTNFELLQFIEIIYITNKCNQYAICLSFIPILRPFMRNPQTAVSPHPLNIGHLFMNLFTRNSPSCHLLKYLLFLLKHPVYLIKRLTSKLLHVSVYLSPPSSCVLTQNIHTRKIRRMYIYHEKGVPFSVVVTYKNSIQ